MAATVIGIAVVEHRGMYLVGTRGPDAPLAGLAEFPGGKCRAGESPAECARRECREESGLDVEPVELLHNTRHDYPEVTVDLHFWRCRVADESAVAAEHTGFRWVPLAELSLLEFPAGNKEVIALLSGSAPA